MRRAKKREALVMGELVAQHTQRNMKYAAIFKVECGGGGGDGGSGRDQCHSFVARMPVSYD